MEIIASVRYPYSPSGNNVTTGTWVQLQPVDGAGQSLSAGYSLNVTPTGNNAGVAFATNSPSSGPYAMPVECTEFDVFDSSGSTMEIGVGATSGVVRRIALVPPGGPAYPLKTAISKGSLIWVRAVDTAATGGEFMADFKHGRK